MGVNPANEVIEILENALHGKQTLECDPEALAQNACYALEAVGMEGSVIQKGRCSKKENSRLFSKTVNEELLNGLLNRCTQILSGDVKNIRITAHPSNSKAVKIYGIFVTSHLILGAMDPSLRFLMVIKNDRAEIIPFSVTNARLM